MRFQRILALLTGCAASLLAAEPAYAGRATHTLPVSATVLAGCTVNAAPLAWNVPVPINANIDIASSITVRCAPNTAFTVDINDGLHSPGGSGNRRVYNATANAFIKYLVYRNAARTLQWTTGAGGLAGNTGATGTVILPTYGRLNMNNNLRAGGYTDTLTVTVNF